MDATLHERAKACGLERRATHAWCFRGKADAEAWRDVHNKASDDAVWWSDPGDADDPQEHPTEDAALLRVVEHLEAKRAEPPVPWLCPADPLHPTKPCGVCGHAVCTAEECTLNAGSELNDGRWACSAEHWEQMASEKDTPDLMVHHTPAAVERWEVENFEAGRIDPGWEPFAVTVQGRDTPDVWCRRRLPAGVSRG